MVKTFYLSNGLKVAMEYMPQYRSVSMGVWVKAGSVNENKQTNGMAHVIEHMLFKGTEKRTARELADAMTESAGIWMPIRRKNIHAFTRRRCMSIFFMP